MGFYEHSKCDECFSCANIEYEKVEFDFCLSLHEIEKIIVLKALRYHNFNRTKTAKVLGIGIRTLQRKLRLWGGDEHEKQNKISA